MRVLMTADTVGGVWGYALELARAFGDEVDIALTTMGVPLTSAQWEEACKLPNVKVFESDYQLEWMDSPWDDVARAGDWLLQLEHEFAPDVVHLNGFVHAALPWRAPAIVVGHSCVLSWWQAVKGESAPAAYDDYYEQVRRGLQHASLVVAPTSSMLAMLEAHYGVLANTLVIPNGRSTHQYRSARKEPFILSAGRLWDEAKNVITLAQTAPQLPWQVLVAGDVVHPDGHQAQFENVRGLGRLSSFQLADWMSRAPIFALPARYEPFGLSPLEAALSGCALVLGDITSLREVWGDAAFFVPPDDVEALAHTINRLITNLPLRAMMAAHGLNRARMYSPQRMAEHYLGAYQQVIAAKQGITTCEFASSTTH